MTTPAIQLKNELFNANIYIDYQCIVALLKQYGVNPLAGNFFQIILDKYQKIYRFNIIDCIAYCDFEKESFPRNQQTVLQNYGIQFRHVARGDNNSNNLIMTTDIVTALYKNPNINQFIIVASGWDVTPLLKLIQMENKSAHVLLAKKDLYPGISDITVYHECLEDIFNLAPELRPKQDADQDLDFFLMEPVTSCNPAPQTAETIKRFLNSEAWWRITGKQTVRFH